MAQTMVTMKIVRFSISPLYFSRITIRMAKQKQALTKEETYRPIKEV
jgi:hypothetical protein